MPLPHSLFACHLKLCKILESQNTFHLQKYQMSVEVSLYQSYNHPTIPNHSPQVSQVFAEMPISEL